MDDRVSDDQQSPAPSHISPFERIRQVEGEREFWRARDLAEVLRYTRWVYFDQAIGRGIRACRNSGQDIADHFRETTKMITIGKGGQRRVKDYQLSRYACVVVRIPLGFLQQLLYDLSFESWCVSFFIPSVYTIWADVGVQFIGSYADSVIILTEYDPASGLPLYMAHPNSITQTCVRASSSGPVN